MQLHSMVTLGTTSRLEIQNLFLTYQRYMFVYSYACQALKKHFFTVTVHHFCFTYQGAKKGMSYSLGLVDFAIGLMNSVLSLPDEQAKIFRGIKITKVL